MSVDIVREFPDTRWDNYGPTRGVEATLEDGHVLSFPQLKFELAEVEYRFLDDRWLTENATHIALRWPERMLHGAVGDARNIGDLRTLMARYAELSEALALRLFPRYSGHLRRGDTLLHPIEIAGRLTPWRQDDSRMHVDASASQPTRGARVLRVYSNLNPRGKPREWRLGEPFAAHAQRYLRSITRPLPGSSWLLNAVRATQGRRTAYDHVMLQLHDHAMADLEFQHASSQARVNFAPDTTWAVFSDQVVHAEMGGQHVLEQIFYLDVEHQVQPNTSPLHTLERLLKRPLR